MTTSEGRARVSATANGFRSRDLGPDVGKPSLKLWSLGGIRRLHMNLPPDEW